MTFDKRGTGMSDRVAEFPGLDQRMDDLRAVMDAAGMEQAALLGISEGAPLSVLFAATYPDRCRALILYGSFSRFSYWFPTEEALAAFFGYVEQSWGTGGSVQRFVPSRANDPTFQRWWGRNERLGASPAAVVALMRMNSQIDISGILPAVRVPTLVIHRTGDTAVNVEGGRDLAAHIPGARLLEVPGNDHIFYVGESADEIADAIEEFLTGSRRRCRLIASSPRFSSPTSSVRRRRLRRSATSAGAICSTVTMPRSGAISSAFGAMR